MMAITILIIFKPAPMIRPMRINAKHFSTVIDNDATKDESKLIKTEAPRLGVW